MTKMEEEEFYELYKEEVESLNGMEYESAPSGEWAEYNTWIIAQEGKVEMLERVLHILGYKDWIEEEEER